MKHLQVIYAPESVFIVNKADIHVEFEGLMKEFCNVCLQARTVLLQPVAW